MADIFPAAGMLAGVMSAVRPSLYEFAGGGSAFLALATAHHARCLADPELNHPFSHDDQHPQHVQRLAWYWAEALGGPPSYTASCGTHSGVLRMHSEPGDMTDLGRRFVACFIAAMDDAGLPKEPDFRHAMSDYIRWATDDMLSHGAPGVATPTAEAMPRWSWDGLAAG